MKIGLGGRPLSKLEISLGVCPAPNKLSRWAGKRAAESLWTIPEKEIPCPLILVIIDSMQTLLNVTNLFNGNWGEKKRVPIQTRNRDAFRAKGKNLKL
jgi:hypothetical protein